ncbi:Membrane-bound lytic murein transglycosylase D precursor [Fulvivirga imtechensis AK7]|uniref:Membrane-bound lytic murein transglycosylase D n=1 Tax=Fulvivirga imtechensis AK7 TaxID=1237149 RepID=L8JNL6_9BACT|nr:lytic transglycosylase domain-containing protein [Fulvivirga imtechensis]ELR70435.1 Membrane-bound lytic murein transglycosylase D precursor [Fulvivirga imtechensis AK7]
MRVLFFLLLVPVWVFGQSPVVPTRMEFAGIKLRLMDDARAEIQKDVDALTKSPKYFNIKVERAKAYFPIIERVLKEEGIHDDFKYLVLQESALIPDAVSTSDAVGFWQFKDFTALEVGLRVDNHIDERMNIVSATRGAARYMKKNNQFFDNWLHTLQAYQMGAGGAMRALNKDEKGARSMVINKKTYWYVKKYLAHKVAFEGAVGGAGETRLMEYAKGANKTLKDISQETGIAHEQLEAYNKWLRKGKIPSDRQYTVILPVSTLDNITLASITKHDKPVVDKKIEYRFPQADNFPKIEDKKLASLGRVVEINDLPGVIGKPGDNAKALAEKGEVDLSKFLKYNDLEISEQIQEGQVYYFKSKRAKANAHYYVAQPDETLWSISQKFGIKLKKLKMKNRIRGEEQIKPGRVLWLRYIRPARIAIEYRQVEYKPAGQQIIMAQNAPKADHTPSVAIKNDPVGDTSAVQIVEPDTTRTMSEETTLKDDEKEKILIAEQKDTIESDMEVADEPLLHEEEEPGVKSIKRVHIVKPGETLYAISKQYEVTVKELLEWNNLNISDGLSIDQKLVVLEKAKRDKIDPAAQAKKTENIIYHTVAQGDTLYKIARSYDVTIEEIMTWNDKKDFSISLGEKIEIRKRQVN